MIWSMSGLGGVLTTGFCCGLAVSGGVLSTSALRLRCASGFLVRAARVRVLGAMLEKQVRVEGNGAVGSGRGGIKQGGAESALMRCW